MSYVDGFLIPVAPGKRDEYLAVACKMAAIFKEFGATRVVEAWGDDVAVGKVTDFRRAVAAQADEGVVFSWIEYPSKEIRDAASKKVMEDPRMKEMGVDMPFDGKRVVFGGFVAILDQVGDPP